MVKSSRRAGRRSRRLRRDGLMSSNGIQSVQNTSQRLTGTESLLNPTDSSEIRVSVGSAFALDTQGLGCGTQSALARLRDLGQYWDEWRFVSLRVRYKPFVGSTATGRVCLAAIYDGEDTNPLSILAMKYVVPHVEGPCWKPLTLDIPCQGAFALNWYNNDATAPPTRNLMPIFLIVGTSDGPTTAVDTGTIEVDWLLQMRFPSSPATNPPT